MSRAKPAKTGGIEGLGRAIRRLRRQQGRTLEETAKASGYTKSLLSKIENGRVVPPIATLVRLARALGTSVASLVQDDGGASAAFDPGSAAGKAVQTEKGYFVFPFGGGYGNKKMQPFLFIARKGELKMDPLSHEGEEFIYVLKGAMTFHVGTVAYRLASGDALYFNALEEHHVEPLTKEVRYLDVFV